VKASRVNASNMWGCHEKLLKKNISGGLTGSCMKHVGLSRENLRKILVGASRVHASNMWGCHEKLLKKKY
jgi:hypothetical protein